MQASRSSCPRLMMRSSIPSLPSCSLWRFSTSSLVSYSSSPIRHKRNSATRARSTSCGVSSVWRSWFRFSASCALSSTPWALKAPMVPRLRFLRNRKNKKLPEQSGSFYFGKRKSVVVIRRFCFLCKIFVCIYFLLFSAAAIAEMRAACVAVSSFTPLFRRPERTLAD